MKPKKNLLPVFGLMMLFASCSKKSDPQPSSSSLASAQLSMSTAQPIAVPNALSTSSDIHAQEAYSLVTSANDLTSLTASFDNIPSGASKSSTAIVGVNVGGRIAATQQSYLVYTWTDPQSGGSVAYQVSETTDSYTFELFYKKSGSSDWIRYLDAEEKKDKSSGFLKVFDPSITKVSSPVFYYTWTRGTNTLNFVITDDTNYKLVINSNTQTKAGDVESYTNNVLGEKLTWDNQGHGTWALYDSDGITVASNGTW